MSFFLYLLSVFTKTRKYEPDKAWIEQLKHRLGTHIWRKNGNVQSHRRWAPSRKREIKHKRRCTSKFSRALFSMSPEPVMYPGTEGNIGWCYHRNTEQSYMAKNGTPPVLDCQKHGWLATTTPILASIFQNGKWKTMGTISVTSFKNSMATLTSSLVNSEIA
jgi:hypothetical protein